MIGFKGVANGGGWTVNSCWVFMGIVGIAKLVWGVRGVVVMFFGVGTIFGVGNTGRE